MSTSYLSTLEDLAARRRTIGDLITALANVVGVDAAPYLDRQAAVTDAEVDDVVDHLRAAATPKRDTPPRPQPPASPTTNGAGHDDKVLELLEGGPQTPKAISDRLRIPKWTLKPVMQRLIASKKVKATGERRGLKYHLA